MNLTDAPHAIRNISFEKSALVGLSAYFGFDIRSLGVPLYTACFLMIDAQPWDGFLPECLAVGELCNEVSVRSRKGRSC